LLALRSPPCSLGGCFPLFFLIERYAAASHNSPLRATVLGAEGRWREGRQACAVPLKPAAEGPGAGPGRRARVAAWSRRGRFVSRYTNKDKKNMKKKSEG
jgi:hypothetical protein